MSRLWSIAVLARVIWLAGRLLPLFSDDALIRMVRVVSHLVPARDAQLVLTDLIGALSAGKANVDLLRRAVAGTKVVEIDDLLWGQLVFRRSPLTVSRTRGRALP